MNSLIKKTLAKETAIYVYVDLANVFHWQSKLKWGFHITDFMNSIKALGNVKEIKVYFGDNPKKPTQSMVVKKRFRKLGAIYKSKPVKFIKKPLEEVINVRGDTLSLFSSNADKKLKELVAELQGSGIEVEEPKCNFDVEMTMDILDDEHKMSALVLFSGDSDLAAPLERVKLKGKRIYVVAVRGSIGHELKMVADHYIPFGKFYSGRKQKSV